MHTADKLAELNEDELIQVAGGNGTEEIITCPGCRQQFCKTEIISHLKNYHRIPIESLAVLAVLGVLLIAVGLVIVSKNRKNRAQINIFELR